MRMRVLAQTVIVKTFDVWSSDPDEALDEARQLAEQDITNGDLEGWDMTAETQLLSAEPDDEGPPMGPDAGMDQVDNENYHRLLSVADPAILD